MQWWAWGMVVCAAWTTDVSAQELQLRAPMSMANGVSLLLDLQLHLGDTVAATSAGRPSVTAGSRNLLMHGLGLLIGNALTVPVSFAAGFAPNSCWHGNPRGREQHRRFMGSYVAATLLLGATMTLIALIQRRGRYRDGRDRRRLLGGTIAFTTLYGASSLGMILGNAIAPCLSS